MHMGEIRAHILCRLRNESGRNWFSQAQRQHPTLRAWTTIEPFLDVFERRDKVGYQRQDALLRLVVDQAQQSNEPRRWHELLLYLFLPGLVRIRARTHPGAFSVQDLDGMLWLSFFEIARHYPLARKGSVAAGILLDTSKRYFRALRQEQAYEAERRQLVAYVHLAAEESEGVFDLGDHQVAAPQLTVDEEEREAMDAWLQQRGVPGEDSALLVATSVLGMTIREYMGVRRADEREFQRLKKRRQRARQKLLDGLQRRQSA
jgi:hypothetical protein